MSQLPPVLTIDGPSGSGKGTISKCIAEQLGWHYLDSGALYRALGIAALKESVEITNETAVADLINHIKLEFKATNDGGWAVFLNGEEAGHLLQTEDVGHVASTIAVFPKVRSGLLAMQKSFQAEPGLVADGRDMGSVVFPEAQYKVYLTASTDARVKRRYKQLIEKGISANVRDIIRDIEQRDERDKTRWQSPLVVPAGAVYIDSSLNSIDEVVKQVLSIME